MTFLSLLCSPSCSPPQVSALLERSDLRPELRDENNRTALHVAAWFNKEGAVARLLALEPAIAPNDRDSQGNTGTTRPGPSTRPSALMLAAKYGTRPTMEVSGLHCCHETSMERN